MLDVAGTMFVASGLLMRYLIYAIVLLSQVALFGQDTISVNATDAPETMYVCSAAVSAPCATAPKATSAPDPTYSDEARKMGLQGVVLLSVVVGSDGLTHNVTVEKSLGHGLDEQATSAVQHWKFQPGTYNGNPVPVLMHVEVNFRLAGRTIPVAPAQTTQTNGVTNTSVAVNADIRNLFTSADEANKRHDYQTAADLARRVTDLAPNNANGWNLLGTTLLHLHQWDAAAASLRRAVELDPGSSFAYNNLGRVYWVQRKYDEAAAQFQKQIAINPEDHYAHANLGMMLRDEKRCDAALPELQKALTITPTHSGVLLAMGECDIEKGDNAKGFSEIEQAASVSPSAGAWNQAAYILAKHNVELERAEKWVQDALAMDSTQLHSVSLDHLSAPQFSLVNSIAAQWDTLGWIYFARGDLDKAADFVRASWSLSADPVVGDHLGQILEKLDHPEEARHIYAMAIAAADDPLANQSAEAADAVSHSNDRLGALGESKRGARKAVENAKGNLQAQKTVMIPNSFNKTVNEDFLLKFSAGKIAEARRLSGDSSLDGFKEALISSSFSLHMPMGVSIEIAARGTLQCTQGEGQCRFVLFSPREAQDLAMKESASSAVTLQQASATDSHAYKSASMGIQLSLADGWQLVTDMAGNFSRPHNVLFKKADTLAELLLTRERLQSSPDLYRQMLDAGFSGKEEFSRTADAAITQDGIPGTRWDMAWKVKGIRYRCIVEIFSVGDDHYRISAMAPAELYGRYQQDFEDMLHSVKFPLLRIDSKLLESPGTEATK